MAFTVRFVATEAQVPSGLWEAGFAPPLEGRWWYAALEQAGLQDQFEFLYAVIHEDGVPVGLAPAFVMGFPVAMVAPPALLGAVRVLGRLFPSLDRPRTLFVGSPCADEGTVAFLPGVRRGEAVLALQAALEEKSREAGAALLVWKDFRASDGGELDEALRRRGLFGIPSFPGTVVELPEGGKEAYFASLPGRYRYKLRKKLRKSKARDLLSREVLQHPPPQVLGELFGLFRQTYEKAAVRFEELNLAFFVAVAKRRESHFVVLRERASGAAVAFMLCFDLGPRIINKFIGIDYRRPEDWHLYFLLWDAAMDWALSRGGRSIQSGQTGYRAKFDTGHHPVFLTNYCAFRNPAMHALARLFARHISWSTLDGDLAAFLRAHPLCGTPPKGS